MKHTKPITKVTAPQSAQLLVLLQKLSLVEAGIGLYNDIIGFFFPDKVGNGGETQE